MKIEYQKQAQGSFLILGEMEQASAFFLQMLAENEISGLFPCSLQNFNGEKRLSYAVCGSSLETFAKRQALTATDIQTFFTALYLVLLKLQEYFLPADGLLLSPEMIYFYEGSFYFCYDPSVSAALQDKTTNLAQELLSMIDQEDEFAVTYAYRFYKLVREDSLGLEAILTRVIEKPKEKENAADYFPEERKQPEETEKEKKEIQKKYTEDESEENMKNKKVLVPFFFTGVIFLSLIFIGYCIYTGRNSVMTMVFPIFFCCCGIFGNAIFYLYRRSH